MKLMNSFEFPLSSRWQVLSKSKSLTPGASRPPHGLAFGVPCVLGLSWGCRGATFPRLPLQTWSSCAKKLQKRTTWKQQGTENWCTSLLHVEKIQSLQVLKCVSSICALAFASLQLCLEFRHRARFTRLRYAGDFGLRLQQVTSTSIREWRKIYCCHTIIPNCLHTVSIRVI
jgi:hypothetical protein